MSARENVTTGIAVPTTELPNLRFEEGSAIDRHRFAALTRTVFTSRRRTLKVLAASAGGGLLALVDATAGAARSSEPPSWKAPRLGTTTASRLPEHAPMEGPMATSTDRPVNVAESAYVKISDDFTIHYEASGEGDIAVIFVPGWTMTTRVFERQLAHFAGSKRFRAVTYDPRGQGLSTKTAEGHYYEQHGRDLHNFIEKLGLQRTILVGWSNGGFDALAYLNQFGSHKLVGLVMLDTTPKGRGTDYTKEWAWFGTKDEGDQDDTFKLFSFDVLIDRQRFNVSFAEWLLENPSAERMRFVFDQTNQTSDAVAALLNTSGWFVDYSQELTALNDKVPLLYVVREEWKDLATAWASTNTPSAEVVAFGKHMMFWEQHEEFNAVLDRFLEIVK